MTMETLQLDWRGMRCPEPILKTAREVRSLKKSASGGRVLVLADDDAFPADIEQWCLAAGVTLEGVTSKGGGYEATLTVGSATPDAAAPALAQVVRPAPSAGAAAEAPEVTPEVLDCRGMRCPEPIMKAARAVRKLEPGARLDVLADDSAFVQDIEAWGQRGKATLLEVVEEGDAWRAKLEMPGAQIAAAPAPTPAPTRRAASPTPAASASARARTRTQR